MANPSSLNKSSLVVFEIKDNGIPALQKSIQDLRSAGILVIYKEFYTYFRNKTAQRYRQAAFKTQYAKASLGTRQQVSGRVRGRGALFGIDSGALFSQLVNYVKIGDRGIQIYSDLSYAQKIMEFYARKGPFAPNSILFADDEDAKVLQGMISKRIQKAL